MIGLLVMLVPVRFPIAHLHGICCHITIHRNNCLLQHIFIVCVYMRVCVGTRVLLFAHVAVPCTFPDKLNQTEQCRVQCVQFSRRVLHSSSLMCAHQFPISQLCSVCLVIIALQYICNRKLHMTPITSIAQACFTWNEIHAYQLLDNTSSSSPLYVALSQ